MHFGGILSTGNTYKPRSMIITRTPLPTGPGPPQALPSLAPCNPVAGRNHFLECCVHHFLTLLKQVVHTCVHFPTIHQLVLCDCEHYKNVIVLCSLLWSSCVSTTLWFPSFDPVQHSQSACVLVLAFWLVPEVVLCEKWHGDCPVGATWVCVSSAP